jgi:hypothetical protein
MYHCSGTKGTAYCILVLPMILTLTGEYYPNTLNHLISVIEVIVPFAVGNIFLNIKLVHFRIKT